MKYESVHSSGPEASDIAELIEGDTKLAHRLGEMPQKISVLIEQGRDLAATDPDDLSPVEVLAYDKTRTEIKNHSTEIAELSIKHTVLAAALEGKSKRAK
jgi:hypothetical protein